MIKPRVIAAGAAIFLGGLTLSVPASARAFRPGVPVHHVVPTHVCCRHSPDGGWWCNNVPVWLACQS
jgi:hypothetical protein